MHRARRSCGVLRSVCRPFRRCRRCRRGRRAGTKVRCNPDRPRSVIDSSRCTGRSTESSIAQSAARPSSVSNAMRPSLRASAAPGQKCGPCPNARFVRALARAWSKLAASGYFASSRLAQPYIIMRTEPASIATPPTSTSTLATRGSICTGLSSRSASSTRFGISERSAATAAICSGCSSSNNMPAAIILVVVSLPATSSCSITLSSSVISSRSPARSPESKRACTRSLSRSSRGLGLAFTAPLRHVVLHLDPAASAGELLLRGEQPRQRRDRIVAPLLEPWHVGPVDPERIGDHGERQPDGELGHQLDATAIDPRVDEGVGDGADRVLELGDALGQERLVDERPELGVHRRIGGEQRAHAPVALGLDRPEFVAGRARHERVAHVAAEPLGVTHHRQHVLVAAHDVEAHRRAVHGGLLAHAPVEVVRALEHLGAHEDLVGDAHQPLPSR